jgi:hypothetical protein
MGDIESFLSKPAESLVRNLLRVLSLFAVYIRTLASLRLSPGPEALVELSTCVPLRVRCITFSSVLTMATGVSKGLKSNLNAEQHGLLLSTSFQPRCTVRVFI